MCVLFIVMCPFNCNASQSLNESKLELGFMRSGGIEEWWYCERGKTWEKKQHLGERVRRSKIMTVRDASVH